MRQRLAHTLARIAAARFAAVVAATVLPGSTCPVGSAWVEGGKRQEYHHSYCGGALCCGGGIPWLHIPGGPCMGGGWKK